MCVCEWIVSERGMGRDRGKGGRERERERKRERERVRRREREGRKVMLSRNCLTSRWLSSKFTY